jgi:hypothetical protein
LQTIKLKNEKSWQLVALGAIAPHLPPGQTAEARRMAQGIDDQYERSRALAALADALKAVKNVKGNVLTSEERRKGISEAVHLSKNNQRVTLARITGRFDTPVFVPFPAETESNPEQALSNALQTAKTIVFEEARLSALRPLYKYLRREQVDDALQGAKGFENEYYRASALAELAPVLGPDQFREAVQAAKTILDNGDRLTAFGGLAGHVGEPDRNDVMIGVLDAAGYVPRPDAFKAVEKAAPLIRQLGASTAVQELRRAIEDVCRWYP